jgi:methionyl-tRNA formyltransferase
MNILFMGTPEFAVPTLRLLASGASEGFKLLAAICQPDRPAGRRGETRAPAVKTAALELGIPVHQPEKIRSDEAFALIQHLHPDVAVVVAYGQIIPPRVFSHPRWGAINGHASLLPKYRGAAPIQWAIARGEQITGVTTMQIEAGLDTGAMLLQQAIPIGPEETAPDLSRRLSELTAELMLKTLRSLETGAVTPQPQNEAEATLAPLLKKEDGRADWSMAAVELYNRWRGFQPWPGLYTTFRGSQLTIRRCHPADASPDAGLAPGSLIASATERLACVCGRGVLGLDEVQLEGRRSVSGAEFIRGARIAAGASFG